MQGLVLPPGAFRLLLAFAVMASHLSNLDIGRLAVLAFFFLSGYWISDIWRGKFAERDTLRFYASRFLRIWPLFLIVTLVSAAVKAKALGLTNFTLLGLAASGERHDPTNVSWSLDIELQFYLIAPFLLAMLAKAPRLLLAASVALLPLGWWLDYALGGLTVLKFLPIFVLGAWVNMSNWTPSARIADASFMAFVGLSGALAFTSIFWKSQPDLFDRDIVGLIWMLPLVPYIARSLTEKGDALDRTLGNLSFPLYLVHPLVIYVIAQNTRDDLATKGLVVLVASAAAIGLYYLVDRPLDRLRVKLTERRRPPAFALSASQGR